MVRFTEYTNQHLVIGLLTITTYFNSLFIFDLFIKHKFILFDFEAHFFMWISNTTHLLKP